jgi:aspartate/methionine/tyrosine aminotransferase
MPFKRMVIEEWFDKYQFKAETNIGESGVKWITLGEIGLDLSGTALRYGHHLGSPELRELIAGEYVGLSPEHIAVTTGSSEAIFAITASLVKPQDEIIIELPNYPSHYYVAQSLGRNYKFCKLRFENKFQLDIEELSRLITSKTKLVSLTHPNNPTGSIISKEDLNRVIELIEANDAYLLMDETYRDLSFSEPPPAAASISSRAISVTTMSKTYGAPGIRIGWAAVKDTEIIDMICTVREQITICNSSIGETIAYEILSRKDELLNQNRKLISKNLNILTTWMEEQDRLEWVPPEAGVVAFPRLLSAGSTDWLCTQLIEDYATFTVPGTCFEMPDHLRLGFGGSTEHLRRGLANMGLALVDMEEVSLER